MLFYNRFDLTPKFFEFQLGTQDLDHSIQTLSKFSSRGLKTSWGTLWALDSCYIDRQYWVLLMLQLRWLVTSKWFSKLGTQDLDHSNQLLLATKVAEQWKCAIMVLGVGQLLQFRSYVFSNFPRIIAFARNQISEHTKLNVKAPCRV